MLTSVGLFRYLIETERGWVVIGLVLCGVVGVLTGSAVLAVVGMAVVAVVMFLLHRLNHA